MGKTVLIMELINNVAKAHGLYSLAFCTIFTCLFDFFSQVFLLFPFNQVGFQCLPVLVSGLEKATICIGK